MFISKHHYALALSRLGNEVYFLNSPSQSGDLKSGEVIIESTQYEHLHQIKHKLFYPYIIKYKAKWLHRLLLKTHINKIISKIGKRIDVVWSFDISDTISLRSFPASCYKIFMPVDEPAIPTGVDAATSANVIFSVTNEILQKYNKFDTPKLFTNHGVSDIFLKDTGYTCDEQNIQIGLSGNFFRPDIDWPTLLKIIDENPTVTFNFWGAVAGQKTNMIGDAYSGEANHPDVSNKKNVILHGSVPPSKLAEELHKMDGFLICYDIDKDQSGGTNYHKVLEYMATGRVIVSNNITTYNDTDGFIEMPTERNNSKLAALFSNVVSNIAEYNSADRQAKRLQYASNHTYEGNITRIEEFIAQA